MTDGRAPPPLRGGGRGAGSSPLPDPGPARVEPPCPHFGSCGGCVLQHWRDDAYMARKSDVLASALHRAGFGDVALSAPARTQPGERRRMDLAARRTRDGVLLGLHRLRSTEVVDLNTCHVLHPTLVALIAPVRRLLTRMQALHRDGSLIANVLDRGVDLLLRTDATLTLADRLAVNEFARVQNLPRVAWAQGNGEAEPICILRPPVIALSGVAVSPPPGAFLQASAAGEAAIVGTVLDALPDKLPARARIAELYAGCGTITFALARRGRVTAWEGDAASIAALRFAANQAGLAGRIEAVQRDLARQPVMAKELAGVTAVVLDPPHGGAAAQMAQIVAAMPPLVIYVSCNPATLARDARTLHLAGYQLVSARPIDQFLWSARLESVCCFRR
jgi:23S rRNA (uracil1939-C5)-methyltransferase